MTKRRRYVPSKTELIARMHRGLRPRLTPDQLLDLSLRYISNLDLISNGQGTEELLWHVVAGALLWSKVAEMLVSMRAIEPEAIDETTIQVELTTRMVQRYGQTGRVGFSGPDYQLAKKGFDQMEELATKVDRPTAIVAAEWAERRMHEMAEACRARMQARTELPAEQGPQQVLKAEGSRPDATDRGALAITSPVGGPTGAWQPAAAGPAWGKAA